MTHQVYKKLRPGHQYACYDIFIRLLKKGYHPSTGYHNPIISVAEHNALNFESKLKSGELQIGIHVYKIQQWSELENKPEVLTRLYDVRLGLVPTLAEVIKSPREKPIEPAENGLPATNQGGNYLLNDIPFLVIIKGSGKLNLVHDYFTPVVSLHRENVDAVEESLKCGAIEYNKVVYEVISWHHVKNHVGNRVHLKLILNRGGKGISNNKCNILDEVFNGSF